MKKLLMIGLAVIMLFALVACGGNSKPEETPDQTADTSLEYIKDKGTIIVGLDDAFPPYGYRDENNNLVGFDIDLATEVAKRMGVEIEFQPIVWDNKIMEINNKNIDCIWNGFTISEEMKQKVLFTSPYVDNKQIIVVKTGSGIATKADLAGKIVGVQAGSSAIEAIDADAATKETFKELVQIKDNVMALTELKNGTVDAVVLDQAVGMTYVSSEPETYTVLEEGFGEEKYGIGVRLGEQALADEIDKILDEMRADGTFKQIADKWPDVVGAIVEK